MTFLAAVSLLAGCGGDSSPTKDRIKAALHEVAKALRNEDVRTYCFKTFASGDLPARVAHQLGVSAAGQPSSGWDREYRACVSQFGKRGEFRTLGHGSFMRSKYGAITVGPRLSGTDGISRTATVKDAYKNGPPALREAKLVEFRGDWKVLIYSD